MRNALFYSASFFLAWFLLNSYSTKFRPSDMYFVDDFRAVSESEMCNIILGNSRSLSAIDASALEAYQELPTLHLGYSSADMLTQHTIFRYALSHTVQIGRVFLEISPFHFDKRRVSTHDIVHVLTRRDPLLIFHPEMLRLEFIQDLFPNSKTLRRAKNSFSEFPYADYSDRNECNEADKSQDTFLRIEELRQVFDDDEIQFEQHAQELFLELLEMCRENSIDVVIILTPSSEAFQSGLSNYDEYKVLISELLQSFPEVTVVDADQCENQQYLKDPDHIACPIKFTREVIIPGLP